MITPANNTFRYAGKQYLFFAKIYNDDSKNTDNNFSYALENGFILNCEITSELNKLFIYGSMEYIDTYGRFDKFITTSNSYITISICEVEEEIKEEKSVGWLNFGSKKTVTYKYSEDKSFLHTFYIEKMEILERKGNALTYKISFVSNLFLSLLKNIRYTNYDLEEESIFDIIKNCMNEVKLKVDETTFDEIVTDVKLHYISTNNDNLLSITNFLMNKLYYYSKTDDSVKFLYFDIKKEVYKIFDMKNLTYNMGVYEIPMSFTDQTYEVVAQGSTPIGFGTVTKFENSKVLKNQYTHIIHSYDFDKNIFSQNIIQPYKLNSYINNHREEKNFIDRYNLNSIVSENDYINNFTYWNGDINIYDYVVNTLTKNNAIVINVVGDILRQCGSLVNITINRSMKDIISQKLYDSREMLNRYKNYDGIWVAGRVRTIISPRQSTFRQNIVLFRNIKTDSKP